jgi:hypothetical protein
MSQPVKLRICPPEERDPDPNRPATFDLGVADGRRLHYPRLFRRGDEHSEYDAGWVQGLREAGCDVGEHPEGSLRITKPDPPQRGNN